MEGVKAIPRNAQAAAQRKADEAVAGVKSIPDRIVEALQVHYDGSLHPFQPLIGRIRSKKSSIGFGIRRGS